MEHRVGFDDSWGHSELVGSGLFGGADMDAQLKAKFMTEAGEKLVSGQVTVAVWLWLEDATVENVIMVPT